MFLAFLSLCGHFYSVAASRFDGIVEKFVDLGQLLKSCTFRNFFVWFQVAEIFKNYFWSGWKSPATRMFLLTRT
jgi:hypothetical protein